MSGLGRGQVIWPTGAGKSFLISVICLLFRNARIIVTTKFLDPLKDLHRNIQSVIPTAGIWGGSSHRKGERVSCVSMGTLHHALRDPPDLLIVDEVHEVATSKQMEVLAAFKDARILGLSANHYDRTDGADFELEGLCGPLISQMTYQQAESLGMISPIHVKFLDVDLSLDPCGLRQGALKKQAGLWTNQARNAIFAEELRKYPDDQCLAAVDTVEHAIYLKQLLPEYELVYASIDPEDVVYYQKLGLLPANFTPLSPAGREQLKRDFESGKLRKAIATTVWKRGVNFKQLAVLALLSGSADDISATQIPGRLSRLHSGKSYGLLLDAWDRFNKGFESASRSRMRLYRHLGWTVDLARKAEVVHGGAGGGG
jgi:superfamily II DNA or RNA helicase